MPILSVGTRVGGVASAFRSGQRDAILLRGLQRRGSERVALSDFMRQNPELFGQEAAPILGAEGLSSEDRFRLSQILAERNAPQPLSLEEQLRIREGFQISAEEREQAQKQKLLSDILGQLDEELGSVAPVRDFSTPTVPARPVTLAPQISSLVDQERIARDAAIADTPFATTTVADVPVSPLGATPAPVGATAPVVGDPGTIFSPFMRRILQTRAVGEEERRKRLRGTFLRPSPIQ